MKRKIFSKLLMGALLVASVSSFTSCKDYDDDINSLKDDVAKRALLSDVTALQTKVDGVKTTADQALANAATNATSISGVKTDLAAVKAIADKAAADAAQGIKDAADAKTAADVAQKAADDAKAALADYAKTSDLADYVKNSDLDTKLADYVKASTLAEAVADAKQQIEALVATSKGDFEALKADVEKFKEAYNQIWSAVTNVSLYAAIAPTADGVDKALHTFNGDVIDLTFTKDAVAKADKALTRYKINTTAGTGASDNDGGKKIFFGDPENKDYLGDVAAYSASKISFADKEVVKFPTSIIVRVSPTNAELTKDNVKFIDGTATALNQIEVESVEPYTDLITRGGSASGLWKINLNAVDAATNKSVNQATIVTNDGKRYTGDALTAIGTNKQLLFAIAVNNTADTEDGAGRDVVSEYGLTIQAVNPLTAYKGVFDIAGGAGSPNILTDGLVNKAKLKDVAGRTKVSTAAGTVQGAKIQDYVWKNGSTPETAGTIETATDRTNLTTYPAVKINNGGTVTVDMSKVINSNKFTFKYYYVTRDDANAGGSDASELNAWKGYTYTGNLNTILKPSEKCEFTIEIPETLDKGDYIGFRVYAVNYDGTLCDPDGVPFEVYVGVNKNAVTAAGTFIPKDGEATAVTVVLPITGTFTNGTAFTANKTKTGVKVPEKTFKITNVNFYQGVNADGTPKDAITGDGTLNAKAAYVQLTVGVDGATNWSDWKDDSSAEFVITQEKDGVAENEITITLTKVLPDATNAKAYTWKANQKTAEGDYVAYMYPATAISSAAWTTPSWSSVLGTTRYAFKPMSQAINNLWDETAGAATDNYIFKFGTSKYNATSKTYADDFEVVKSGLTYSNTTLKYSYIVSLEEAADPNDAITELVDNKTKHASSINYNFGKVSSAEVDKNGNVIDYVVKLEDFNTIWACPLEETVMVPTLTQYTNANVKDADGNLIPQDINYLVYSIDNSVGYGRTTNTTVTPHATALSGINVPGFIKFENSYDPVAFNGTLSELLTSNQKFVRIATEALDGAKYKPTFTSDYNGQEDYFTVTITGTPATTMNFLHNPSTISAPNSPVASTLTFYLLDAFGHYHKVAMKFNVLKAAPAAL